MRVRLCAFGVIGLSRSVLSTAAGDLELSIPKLRTGWAIGRQQWYTDHERDGTIMSEADIAPHGEITPRYLIRQMPLGDPALPKWLTAISTSGRPARWHDHISSDPVLVILAGVIEGYEGCMHRSFSAEIMSSALQLPFRGHSDPTKPYRSWFKSHR
jgi:hypothetical protein